MITLVTILVSFNFFQFIENRECSGVSGRVCCDGYALNEITRQCEKCPIGYHRSNCSEKCSYPVYGEDCQYLCDCNKTNCHFVTGCSHHVGTFTDNKLSFAREDATERNFLFSTIKEQKKMVILRTIDYDVTPDSNIYSDTTLAVLPPDTELLKDNLVVRVIISLIGVFVFFFAIFVLTYMYFKCLRKTTNANGGVKETEWQIQYKSLSFDAVESQITYHSEPQGRVNADFTYLTPVFRGNESRESRRTGENEVINENEILPETHLQEQKVCSQETTSRQDEPNSTHEDVQEHVYIEITEEKTESSKLVADPENENQRHINIVQSTSISRESAYTNVNKEEL